MSMDKMGYVNPTYDNNHAIFMRKITSKCIKNYDMLIGYKISLSINRDRKGSRFLYCYSQEGNVQVDMLVVENQSLGFKLF